MAKKLPNRIRNKRITLRVSEEEYKIFQRKFMQSEMNSYSDFVIQSIKKIPIFVVDIKPLLSLSEQVSKIGVNVNQIAKVANTTQNIYVEELRNKIEKALNLIKENLKTWSRIGVGNFNGLHENYSD